VVGEPGYDPNGSDIDQLCDYRPTTGAEELRYTGEDVADDGKLEHAASLGQQERGN
jgi:hypothetical protein